MKTVDANEFNVGELSAMSRFFLVLAIVLGAVGLIALAAGMMPFEVVREQLDPYFGGSASRYSPGLHAKLMGALRWGGLAALALGIGLGWFRHRLGPPMGKWVSREWAGAREDLRQFAGAIRQTPASHGFAMLAVLVIAALVRLHHLWQPIRYDEAFTYQHFASRPLFIGISYYANPFNNHLLHTILTHLSTSFLGVSLWTFRLPALVAGLCLIPAVYALGRVLHGRRAGLLAAAFVAGSSVLISFSTNGRGYTLVCLITVLMALSSIGILDRRGDRYWVLFTLLCVAGMYTIPVMLLVCVAVSWWMIAQALATFETSDRLGFTIWMVASTVAAGVLTLIAYSPVLYVYGTGHLAANRWVEPMPIRAVVEGLPRLLETTGSLWVRDLPRMIVALLLAASASGLVVASKSRQRGWGVHGLMLMLALAFFAFVVVQRALPQERSFLLILPVFLTSAAAGIADVTRRLGVGGRLSDWVFDGGCVAVAAVLSLVVVQSRSVFTATETGQSSEALPISRYLMEHLKDGDRLIAKFPYDSPLFFYFREAGRPYLGYVDETDSGVARRLFVVSYGDEVDTEQMPTSVRPEKIAKAPVVYSIDKATVSRIDDPFDVGDAKASLQ